jgi:CHAT domain-containing protein
MKILFLGANPSNTTYLALTQEVQAIKQHVRSADRGHEIRVEQEWAVKLSDLNAALLRHKPDIVHFSGHGNLAGELVLETESGTATTVKPEAFTNLFKILKRNIRCVVLNACFSASQAKAIAQHIDCVVGMTEAVGDTGATAFAWAFYEALAFNASVREAFDLGCNQVDLNRLPDDKDIPKLISRDGIDPQKIHFLDPR